MRPFPVDELAERVGSRFTIVVAAAKRAKQLKEGARPLLDLPTRNPLTIALHEIAAGLVEVLEAEEVPEEAVVEIAAEDQAPGPGVDLLASAGIAADLDLDSEADSEADDMTDDELAEDDAADEADFAEDLDDDEDEDEADDLDDDIEDNEDED